MVYAGEREGVKGLVHAALGGLAALCLGYNATAYLVRRERHLLYNTCIYAALTWLEVRQVQRHWRRL